MAHFLDGLFSDCQFDPQTYRNPPGSGWLGPIAGGPVPFGQLPSPQGFPTVPSSNVPVATQPMRSRAASAQPGPMQSDAASGPMAGSAVGREAEQQNPLMSLLGGIGDGVSGGIAGLFGQGGQGATLGAANLLDRLTAGATNLTTGGNPIAGLLNAVNGLATGQRTDRAGIELAKQHATMSALMNAGLDLSTARAAAINPDFLKALVVARYGARPMRGQVATPPRPGTEEAGRKEPAPIADVGGSLAPAAGPTSEVAKPRS